MKVPSVALIVGALSDEVDSDVTVRADATEAEPTSKKEPPKMPADMMLA